MIRCLSFRAPLLSSRAQRGICSALFLAALASPSFAQDADTTRSTQDGVYNRAQWLRGQDLYAGNCRSCHSPESHAGPAFVATWNGRTLAALYSYIRGSMPKSDPGSMSPQEYADVLAYLLRLNRMPTGPDELPTDTTAMTTIRFVVPDPPKTGERR